MTGNHFDVLRQRLVDDHAPWLPILEDLERRVAALEGASANEAEPPETHDTTVAGYTQRMLNTGPQMSDVVCARQGCEQHLTKEQAKKGRYCSISCATKDNKPWLRKKGVAGGRNSKVTITRRPITVEAGAGPRDPEDAEAILRGTR